MTGPIRLSPFEKVVAISFPSLTPSGVVRLVAVPVTLAVYPYSAIDWYAHVELNAPWPPAWSSPVGMIQSGSSTPVFLPSNVTTGDNQSMPVRVATTYPDAGYPGPLVDGALFTAALFSEVTIDSLESVPERESLVVTNWTVSRWWGIQARQEDPGYNPTNSVWWLRVLAQHPAGFVWSQAAPQLTDIHLEGNTLFIRLRQRNLEPRCTVTVSLYVPQYAAPVSGGPQLTLDPTMPPGWLYSMSNDSGQLATGYFYTTTLKFSGHPYFSIHFPLNL